MKVYSSIFQYNNSNTSVLTIGTFDGVHLGHQEILEQLVKEAIITKTESIVLTFFPHPRMVLEQESSVKLINTIQEKIALLEKIGIDHLIIHPFDSTFSETEPEEFVKNILVNQLHIQKIIIGYDHRFGKNRAANFDDLVFFGKKYNFTVAQISAKTVEDLAVSSTKIRNAIADGKIAFANALLGHTFSFMGKVVEGKMLGRKLGFPTANILIEEKYKLLPQTGVYIVYSVVHGKTVFGMMNIGKNPTVEGKKQTIEVHYFHFQEDIYQHEITVFVVAKIREEQKFNSLEELQQQLEKDKAFSLEYIQKITSKR